MAEQYDGSIRINTKIETASFLNLIQQIKKTERELQEMKSKMDELGKKNTLSENATKELKGLENELKKAQTEYDRLSAKAQMRGAETTAYKNLKKDLQAATAELKNLVARQEEWEKMGVSQTSGGWEVLNDQIIEAGEKVDSIKEKINNLESSGEAYTPKVDASEVEAASQKVDELNKKIEALKDNPESYVAGVNSEEYRKAALRMDELNNKLTISNKRLSEMEKSFSQARSKKTFTVLSKLAAGLNNVLKKVSNTAKKAFGAITSGADSATRSAKRTQMSFGRMLAMSVAFSGVFRAISAVTSGLADGFTNLINHSESLENSVQSLKNALATLGNSFATAFSPIVQAAIPYLVQLINWITRAINAIAQLFAYLTGKSTWTKATEVQAGYNDELNGTADAAKKAYGALAKFDDLDVLQKQDSGGGPGGTGGATGGFEEVPISEDIKKFGDQLKDIFSKIFAPLKEAWEREGQFVMDAWKYALEEIGLLVKDIGRDFLEVWNQEATIAMFEDILHIIGDIGLVIGNLAHNFREAWNENETGLHILENIRDILAVIIHNIRLAADATVEWSKHLDFSPLLTAFEKFTSALVPAFDALSGILTDFYTQVLLPLSKWVLEEGLPDLLNVLTDFVEKVDWEGLRQNFSDLWDSLEPFAETVGEGLIIFIERVTDLVANFVNSETLENFMDHLADWMDSVEPEDVADGIEDLAKVLIIFKGALVALDGIIAGSKVVSFLANLKTLFRGEKGGLNLTEGAGIVGAGASLGIFKEIGNIWENLFGPDKIQNAEDFANAINHLTEEYKNGKINLSEYKDGVGELTTEAQNAGFSIDENLRQTLENITLENTGKNVAKDFTKGVTEGIEEDKESTSAYFATWGEIIGATLQTAFRSAATLAITAMTSIFGDRWEEITSWFSLERWTVILENVKLAFQTKWNEIITWWTETAPAWWEENIVPWFTVEKWSEIIENIKTAFLEKWEEIKTSLSEKMTEIEAGLRKAWELIKNTIEQKITLIKNKVTELINKFTELKNNVSTAFSNIKTSILNALDPVIEKIKEFIQWVKDAIQAVKDFVSSGVGSIGSAISSAISGGRSAGGSAVSAQSVMSNIPHLASGAVIRGGRPFAAILGDQPAGQTNVEAPMSTIEEALENVMSRRGEDRTPLVVNVNYDGETFARLTLNDIFAEASRQGYDIDILGWTGG